MGYVAAEDQSGAAEGTVTLETTDNFCQRLRGFMLFYAAYMQARSTQVVRASRVYPERHMFLYQMCIRLL